MRYVLQRNGKPGSLLPAECDVQEALAAFTFDPTLASATDFVPTRTLYLTYVRFMVGRSAPGVLDDKQFGAAIRRVYGLDDARQSRRRIGGRLRMGYLFVRGPGSVVTHSGPGNPTLQAGRPDCIAIPVAPFRRMPVCLAC
jgi:hypothetical protein